MQYNRFNPPQNQHPQTANSFYPEMKQKSLISSLRHSYNRGTRHFVPSNRNPAPNISLESSKSPDTLKLPDQGQYPQWNVKPRVTTPVMSFRRKNFLRNKSKVIKISGVTHSMTPAIHTELNKVGEIIELQMKWLNQGDMQVKFRNEKSAKEAMDLLDGMEINGSKLQVTQVFQLEFNRRLKPNFHKTKLQLIKESEDSDDADPPSSNENNALPETILENEGEHIEQLEVPNPLFHNNSTSSIGNNENFSHSEEGEMFEPFNRTQSVRLYPNNVNSNALTSRLNSSYESGGMFDDEEAKHSNSFVSSGSKGSNPNFTST